MEERERGWGSREREPKERGTSDRETKDAGWERAGRVPAWCYSEPERRGEHLPSRRLSRLTRRGAPRYPDTAPRQAAHLPTRSVRTRDPPRPRNDTGERPPCAPRGSPTYLPTYLPTYPPQPTGSVSPPNPRGTLLSVCAFSQSLRARLSFLPSIPFCHTNADPLPLVYYPLSLFLRSVRLSCPPSVSRRS